MNKNMLVVNLIRFIVFFGSLLLFINVMNAQRVFVTDNEFEADYKVWVGDLEDKYRADWIIYTTDNEFEAGYGRFYFTSTPYDANFTIFIVEWDFEADRILFKTEDKFSVKFNEE